MPNIKPIAKVINNNQPGWTNIVETEPHVTLDVGTELCLVDEELKSKADIYTEGVIDDGPVIMCNGEPVKFDDLLYKLNMMSLANADYLRRLRNISRWAG